MKNKDKQVRRDNNKKAYELICKSETSPLTLEEVEELKSLHTGYGGLGDNTQYFTPEEVVEYMISSLKIAGFKGSKVLEPSCGNGIFISNLQKNFDNLDITAVEINVELFNLNKICYPDVNLINDNTLKYCEDFYEKFDLVIGNPPFGKGNKNEKLKLGRNTLEGLFTEFSLNSIKPGGHFIMVLPSSILSNESYIKLREKIINEFIILQCIDLPTETFAKSDTKVSTGILHLRKKELLINNRDNDYKIFMSCVNSVGWDSRLNKRENELIELVKNFEKLFLKHRKDLDIYFKNGYDSYNVNSLMANQTMKQLSMFD